MNILLYVGATLVVAKNDIIDASEKGQAQGIAPTAKPLFIWLGRSNPLAAVLEKLPCGASCIQIYLKITLQKRRLPTWINTSPLAGT